MLSQAFRFHGHGSLKYLYRNGKTARNRAFLLRYVPNERRTDSRATVIVGKKIVKSAVKRNRIRRRVYEVLRLHWDHIPPKTDVALTVFLPELGVLPAPEVERLVLDVLRQARLYRTEAQSVILKDSL